MSHLKLKRFMQSTINAVKYWMEQVVIGLNFCPFAKKVYVNQEINYEVSDADDLPVALAVFAEQCQYLLDHPQLDTSLLIFPQGFADFNDYLTLVDYANELLTSMGLAGNLQLASFHPDYCFSGVPQAAAENYTNRSPFPILHIIREQSIERVLATYAEPEQIPVRNIALAERKGREFFEQILRQAKQKT
jgi:uncharacterized protein